MSLKLLRQIRTAIAHLSPDEVREEARRPIRVGIVATGAASYADMEDFLIGAGGAPSPLIHRAAEAGPQEYDLALFEQGLPCPKEGFTFYRDNPVQTLQDIVNGREDLQVPLARNLPGLRTAVVDAIVRKIAKENALFTLTTAIPNVLPSFIALPWAVSEFASDTAFLTMNQIRMAFLVGAATGKEIGYTEQKIEIASIVAGAFGWRAIARELAGKIPLGGGLIPKAAISYAGTYVLGKGIERFNESGSYLTRSERDRAYHAAYRAGRSVAEGALRPAPAPVTT